LNNAFRSLDFSRTQTFKLSRQISGWIVHICNSFFLQIISNGSQQEENMQKDAMVITEAKWGEIK